MKSVKVGDKVVLEAGADPIDYAAFGGRIGTVVKVYDKDTWDFQDIPELCVNWGVITDSDYNEVDATEVFFYENELEVIS